VLTVEDGDNKQVSHTLSTGLRSLLEARATDARFHCTVLVLADEPQSVTDTIRKIKTDQRAVKGACTVCLPLYTGVFVSAPALFLDIFRVPVCMKYCSICVVFTRI